MVSLYIYVQSTFIYLKMWFHENTITLETFQTPIGDPLKTVMSDQRQTCLIGDRYAFSKTDMADRRPTWLMNHVGLCSGVSVSNQACLSPSVSNQACWASIRHDGLQWVSDRSPIIIILYWTLKIFENWIFQVF